MTKTLALITAASFVLAVACLAGASALGWHGLVAHHWRSWPHDWPENWSVRVNDGRDGRSVEWIRHVQSDDDAGPAATKEIAWSGGDRLEIDIPADVQFTQAPGPGKLVITGPKDAVDKVVVDGASLRFSDDADVDGPIKVIMSAPQVRHFSINGSSNLGIEGFDQDQLEISVSGSGNIVAKGKAHDVKLDISGDGDADLGQLASDSAEADISGSGRATVAPTNAADLRISGSGEIDLKTRPAKVTSDVSGSGKIVEGDQTMSKSD